MKSNETKKLNMDLILSSLLIFAVFIVCLNAVWFINYLINIITLTMILGLIIIILMLTYLVRKYKLKKTIFLILPGVLACAIFFIAFMSIIPWYVENEPASYDYKITARGLNNYSGGLANDILVPMPMKDGKRVFTDDELQYREFDEWKSMITITKEGYMLGFQMMDKNLTDINARFSKRLNGLESIKSPVNDTLSPISNITQSNYTIFLEGYNNSNAYTSYVYVDQNIAPKKDKNETIEFNLEFTAFEGRFRGIYGNRYRASVIETIPPWVTGPIPVKCQLGIFRNGQYVPINIGEVAT